jgi:hypothetical protein
MGHRSNSVILSGGAEEDPEEMDIESMLSKSTKNQKLNGPEVVPNYTSHW